MTMTLAQPIPLPDELSGQFDSTVAEALRESQESRRSVSEIARDVGIDTNEMYEAIWHLDQIWKSQTVEKVEQKLDMSIVVPCDQYYHPGPDPKQLPEEMLTLLVRIEQNFGQEPFTPAELPNDYELIEKQLEILVERQFLVETEPGYKMAGSWVE